MPNIISNIGPWIPAVLLALPLLTVIWDAGIQVLLSNDRHLRRFGFAIHMAGFGLFCGAILRANLTATQTQACFVALMISGALLPINALCLREDGGGKLHHEWGQKCSRFIGVTAYVVAVYLCINLDQISQVIQ
jgi:hypothetical protein